jgi:hypothetical protein
MGRTVLPYRQVLEREYNEWKKFRRGLRKEDQKAFDRLFDLARLHVQAGVYASSPWPLEAILISILLEHHKALEELRATCKRLEETGREKGERRLRLEGRGGRGNGKVQNPNDK